MLQFYPQAKFNQIPSFNYQQTKIQNHKHDPFNPKTLRYQQESFRNSSRENVDSSATIDNDLLQNKTLKFKVLELENKSLMQQNNYLTRELELKQLEIEKILKGFQPICLPSIHQARDYVIDSPQQFYYENSKNQTIQRKRGYSIDQQPQNYNMKKEFSSKQQGFNRNTKLRSQYEESEFENLEEKMSYLPAPVISKTVKNSVSIPNNIQQKNLKPIPKLQKNKLIKKSRLKILFIAVRAAIRWSHLIINNQKNIKHSKISLLQQIEQRFSYYEDLISKKGVEQCKQIIKGWVEKILNPLYKELSTPQFISQSQEYIHNVNSEQAIQQRQQWLMKYSRVLMTQLELQTQKNNVPEIIQGSLYLSMFKCQNIKAPLFVAQRTNFYTKKTLKLGVYQEKMILTEYLVFRLLIYHMLEYSNFFQYQNNHHKTQTKFVVIILTSLLQLIFNDFFEELKQLPKPSTQLFQRRIKITPTHEIQIITDNNIDKEGSLIYGLHNREVFDSIIEREKEWIEEMCNKFSKIVKNIHFLVEF